MRLRTRLARPVGIWSYTPGVAHRNRLITVFAATFLVAPAALANPNSQTDAANAAGQMARQAADMADQAAEAVLPDASGAKESPMERARQGIVILERAGKALGVGTVLDKDGRILTALSQLGHGNNVDARFADGSVARLGMGHTDRAWDLALLVPKTSRWKKGLRASKLTATKAGSRLRAFRMLNAKSVAPSRVIVKGLRTLRGGDSELLPDAVELGSRFKGTDVGSPIVDDHGNVVAVVARACDPMKADICTRVPYGVPVSAVKAFLRTVPRGAVPPAPWLGLQGIQDQVGPVKGVRVLGVHPQSPAAAAGLSGGKDKNRADVVVAVDGKPVTSPEALSQAIHERSVGDTIQLLLFGNGKFREVTVTLRAAPDSGKKAKRPARRSVRRATPPTRPRPKPRARPRVPPR